jgi:co-chaperonin GroES (HSP10)
LKLIPTNKRVIIEIDQSEEKTSSGIILTTKNEKEGGKLQRGTVIAVGKECDDSLIKKGVKVYYNTYDAFEIVDDVGVERWAACPVTGVFAVIQE